MPVVGEFNPNRPNSATDYWKIEAMIDDLKTNEAKLRKLLKQLTLLPQHAAQRNSLSYAVRLNLLQEISKETTTLIAVWGLLQETVDSCFDQHAIENRFALEIKTISSSVENLLHEVVEKTREEVMC